ncbi:hypothetical protein R3P38DRAFT_2558783, partial [Favolaschia claudopus]
YIPTDPEISQIHAQLLLHEAELTRLEALIQDLCAQRDRVKDYLHSHKALISLPRRLPQDILEEIFLACLPATRDVFMIRSAAEPPLLLGRICSRWRSIAFALPTLWSSLHIHVDYVKWRRKRIAAVDEWLKKTSQVPLSISLQGNDGLGSNDDAAVVDILTRHSSQWASLRLYKLSNAALISLAAENAPALSNIEIHFRDDFNEEEERPFLPRPEKHYFLASRFLLNQKQCHISVVTVDPMSFVPTTSFRWSHLTDLSLKHSLHQERELFHMPTALRLFKGCPRLRSLKPPISVGVFEPDVDAPLIVPSLESLSIETYTTTPILLKAFFTNLAMPRLTKFHFVDRSLYSAMDISVFEQLANHSSSISEVHLKVFRFSTTTSILLGLQYFPSITKLSMILWGPNTYTDYTKNEEDELFAILAPTSPSNPVPALEDLSLETRFIVKETWLQFLRGHVKRRTSLRRVRLSLWVGSPDDIPKIDLAEFVDAGLDVLVDYEFYEDPVQGGDFYGDEY